MGPLGQPYVAFGRFLQLLFSLRFSREVGDWPNIIDRRKTFDGKSTRPRGK
jgi:hypothetical protein